MCYPSVAESRQPLVLSSPARLADVAGPVWSDSSVLYQLTCRCALRSGVHARVHWNPNAMRAYRSLYALGVIVINRGRDRSTSPRAGYLRLVGFKATTSFRSAIRHMPPRPSNQGSLRSHIASVRYHVERTRNETERPSVLVRLGRAGAG